MMRRALYRQEPGMHVNQKPSMRAPSSRREYERRINRVIDHVQAHLTDDLTLERLAGVAAFSPFHFHRVFAAITGETLSDFIRRVRLERAAGALISLPETSILEIALRYGFSSAATFARAFKAHFGMSATQWRSGGALQWRELRQGQGRRGKSKRNPDQAERKNRKASAKPVGHRASTGQERIAMRVEVREIPPYRIAYMRHIGPYGTSGAISALWVSLRRWIHSRDLQRPGLLTVGIGHDAPGIVAPEKLRYDAGLIVADDFKPDRSVNVTDLPGGKYAVARFEGSAAVITDAWAKLYTAWLPGSGYQPEDRPRLELRRDHDLQLPADHLRCELCLPIRPL
jgi:AraC family transcriptional regulator